MRVFLAACLSLLVVSACGDSNGTPTPLATNSAPVSLTPLPTPEATPSPTPEPALPPAAVAPASSVTECSLALEIGAHGNAGPLFCPDGGINVLAWAYFAKKLAELHSAGILNDDEFSAKKAEATRQDVMR